MIPWSLAIVLMMATGTGAFLLGFVLSIWLDRPVREAAYRAGYAAARMAALRWRLGVDVEAPAYGVPLVTVWEREN